VCQLASAPVNRFACGQLKTLTGKLAKLEHWLTVEFLMLPHKHFLISAAAAVPFSLHHPEWILASGVISAVVDTDVTVLVWVYAKKHEALAQFRNPINIFTRYGLFMETIEKTGVLKIAMATHLLMSGAILLLTGIYVKGLFVPAVIGVVSHILSDIPNIRKLKF
jgi:hypothetical protein